MLSSVMNLVSTMRGPKYDGVFLHDKIRDLTHGVRIADTVTNVIVPAFDVKYLQPVILTTYEAKNEPLKNAHLSDIYISTSAAPTYFPAHYFKTETPDGKSSREFHLVDGGVAANNPTMVAMSMLTKEVLRRNSDFHFEPPLRRLPGLPHHLRRDRLGEAGGEVLGASVCQVGSLPVALPWRLHTDHRHILPCELRHGRHPCRRDL
jgi:hypothetical protein